MPDVEAQSPIAERTIAMIKSEHRALARILGAMQAWIARARDGSRECNAELFDAMLRYIENVPDRLHHPREDQLLFPAVASRATAARELIRGLEHDHARGEAHLNALHGAFDAFTHGANNGLNQLATAVDEFAEFYWDHMRREEVQLLPLALAQLSVDDWLRVASALGDNADRLFGGALADEYRRLYDYIAGLTPAPLKSWIEDAAPRAVSK